MASTTKMPDTDVFPTISIPVTIGLTSVLLFVILAGFFSLFFLRCLVNKLFSAWTLQQTPYSDLIHVTTPPENTGLDPFIVRSFPAFLYSSATMKNHGMECAICLSEFSDEDTVRLITVCGHVFHSSCIDLWFELHKTCPFCRCELDPGLVGSVSRGSLHNSVTITIQDLNNDEENPSTAGSSKRLVEASAWRFSRSHSTGHFMTGVNVNIKRKHYQTRNFVPFEQNLPTTSTNKRLTEASHLRFSRSHSTGHFMVRTPDINVKIKGRHYQTGSSVMFDEFARADEAAEYVMAW
ncbi:unnamed protein product [Cochlearia groenlandica]